MTKRFQIAAVLLAAIAFVNSGPFDQEMVVPTVGGYAMAETGTHIKGTRPPYRRGVDGDTSDGGDPGGKEDIDGTLNYGPPMCPIFVNTGRISGYAHFKDSIQKPVRQLDGSIVWVSIVIREWTEPVYEYEMQMIPCSSG